MGQGALMLDRRRLVAASALLPLAACMRDASPHYDGGWVGASVDRGHRMRDAKSGALPAPAVTRRAGVVIVGAGVAGLGAARALMRAGFDDCEVLELEDESGGNSRGHAMSGIACPLGAHYLPVPGDDAIEVAALIEELGLARRAHGRWVYDELQLCHSPQERLYIGGEWREGLLPPLDALPQAERAMTLDHYRRFARRVTDAAAGAAYAIPTARARWTPALSALDATTFSAWLAAQGLTAPALRWYLDYCCRDDYGAGAAHVSAWAGLHYFASRHGFHAPGDDSDDRDLLFTWPEGNAWLARRLAAPLGERLRAGRIVLRVVEGRRDVTVDAWDVAAGRIERWTADQVVLAVPTFIAARLLESPPAALTDIAARVHHAPWLVANLALGDPPEDRPGAAPAWDNVIYDGDRDASRGDNPSLGYVDAAHQSTLPYRAGPTVITAYWALGGADAERLRTNRAALLAEPWQAWAARIVHDVARVHPDLPPKVRRVDLMRYGHAMCIPVPGLRSSAALAALAGQQRRVHHAHTDLSAYSVFEEALYHGTRAAAQVLRSAA
ncbi:MAG: FAD-dependent oxidoreductase [Proteobacteria bacterium]|nr:FAD-dependent oxidoreductase [Pseudomonadota bacterium]